MKVRIFDSAASSTLFCLLKGTRFLFGQKPSTWTPVVRVRNKYSFEIFEKVKNRLIISFILFGKQLAGVRKVLVLYWPYREGKVFFPEVGAPEAEMIERKLAHVGVINKDDQRQANLQVWVDFF